MHVIHVEFAVAPTMIEYVPEGQALHDVEASVSEKVPPMQFPHCIEPLIALYRPNRQGLARKVTEESLENIVSEMFTKCTSSVSSKTEWFKQFDIS